MSPVLIAATIIAAIVIAVMIVSIWLAKKRKELGIIRKTDYRLFFRTGSVLMVTGAIGLIYMFFSDIPYITVLPLLAIGAIYIAIGLNNKEAWSSNN